MTGRPLLPPTRRPSPVRSMLVAGAALVGCLVVAGAGWDLWGSQLYGRHRQSVLSGELEAAAATTVVDPLRAVPVVVATTDEYRTRSEVAPPSQNPSVAAPDPGALGQPIGRISIPKIGVDHVIVTGADNDSLRNGPGWYPTTAFPGTPGNAAVAGHRTTYGSPFRHLDKLAVGDRITVSVPGAPDAIYEVRGGFVAVPTDAWALAPTDGVRLTLTTCEPVGSNAKRLVVQAELVEGAALSRALPADIWRRSAP